MKNTANLIFLNFDYIIRNGDKLPTGLINRKMDHIYKQYNPHHYKFKALPKLLEYEYKNHKGISPRTLKELHSIMNFIKLILYFFDDTIDYLDKINAKN